jgi:hypothetical protein
MVGIGGYNKMLVKAQQPRLSGLLRGRLTVVFS